MDIDVALVPQAARPDDPAVFIVVDEIRASTTITTLLDIGCSAIYIEGALEAARRRGRETGSILVGERHLRRPPGFDFANSPMALARAGVEGKSAVLSTTNGTAILRMLRRSEHVLVGCLRNARACGTAAVRLAAAQGVGIRVVCAGRLRRFVLEDAVAAGVIVTRSSRRRTHSGIDTNLTDAARVAVACATPTPTRWRPCSTRTAVVLRQIGQEEDIPFCAEVDVTDTVPILRDGNPMRIERWQP